MVKNLMQKIWNDSVFSKIIAAGLLSVIAIVDTFFWSYKIELWIVS